MESLKTKNIKKDKSQRATTDKVLDNKTRSILKKLEERNILSDIRGCISSGKEANIYIASLSGELDCKFFKKSANDTEKQNGMERNKINLAIDNSLNEDFEYKPEFKTDIINFETKNEKLRYQNLDNRIEVEDYFNYRSSGNQMVAIKIYRTSRLEFRKRQRYIENEKRFQRYCNTNPRKLIKLWAEKELRNLKRLAKAGISVPEPLYLKRNILIMKMIGKDSPALRLKDLNNIDFDKLYLQIIDIIKIMYRNAKLVHCDLSEYNILYYKKLYIIDVGQSLDVSHENSDYFLINDLKNINNFFVKKGIETVNINKLYEDITGSAIPECLNDIEISPKCFIPHKIDEIVHFEDLHNFLKKEQKDEINDFDENENTGIDNIKIEDNEKDGINDFNEHKNIEVDDKNFRNDLTKELERIEMKKKRKEIKEKLKLKRMSRDKNYKKEKRKKKFIKRKKPKNNK